MRVGIIGGGGIAEVHAPLIAGHDDVEIVGVADMQIDRARALAASVGCGNSYAEAEQLVKEQKPDVVHVLVPPQYHADISIMAMDHGCHVLVEKPMATTVAECEAMIEAGKRNGVSLCVEHPGHLQQVIRKVRGLVAEGAIGDVLSVEAHEIYNPERSPALVEAGAENRHWAYKLNGGPLQDMIPHPADLVLEYVKEVKELQFMSANRGIVPAGWDDELKVLLRSDDVMGYISISFSERPDVEAFMVRGTRGTIFADQFNYTVTLRQPSTRLPRKVERGLSGFQLALGLVRDSTVNAVKAATGRIEKANAIETVIAEFYKSIREGGEPPVSVEKGLRVVDLINRVWPEPVVRTG